MGVQPWVRSTTFHSALSLHHIIISTVIIPISRIYRSGTRSHPVASPPLTRGVRSPDQEVQHGEEPAGGERAREGHVGQLLPQSQLGGGGVRRVIQLNGQLLDAAADFVAGRHAQQQAP